MEAESVYVYVNSTYRTSRNFRVEWYFRHLNTRFTLQSLADVNVSIGSDLQVSSDCSVVAPGGADHSSPLTSPTTFSSAPSGPTPGKAVPDSAADVPDCEFMIVAASVNDTTVQRPRDDSGLETVPEHEPTAAEPSEPQSQDPSQTPSDEQLSSASQQEFFLGPSTQVLFLMRHYRLVFVVDMSTSMFSLTDDGDIRLRKALDVLQESLVMLARVVRLPSTDFLFSPLIRVAVIAHAENETRVLLQGWTLNSEGVGPVMAGIRQAVDEFERDLQERAALRSRSFNSLRRFEPPSVHSSPRMRFGDAQAGSCSPPYVAGGLYHAGGPAISCGDLLSMIRHAMIALSFLSSDDPTPGFIVITDENVCMGDAQLLDRTLQMLRADEISCSFIKVGSVVKENLREPSFTNFGQVDYRELCQFIAKATIGSHFNINQRWSLDGGPQGLCYDLNVVQKAFLGWSFERALAPADVEGFNWSDPCKKSYFEVLVKAPILAVLSLRLREGFILKEFKFTRPSSKLTIHVELILHWKPGVLIHYNMTSQWPRELSQETRVQVLVSAHYDFLHEVTCNSKKRQEQSEYIGRLLERFKYLFVGLKRTDYFMENLYRLTIVPAYHTVPPQYRNGLMSVFEYMPGTNLSRPTERNISDQAANSFVEYWTIIKEVDMNTSHRWMHSECVDLILEHDFPLPRHLSVPNSNGKFMSIQCRQAVQLVNQSLRNWASFTLIENHSYVKFIYSSEKSAVPSSFFLIRLGQHSVSAVSLKFAFLAGTTGSERKKQVSQLKDILRSKMFPRRGKNADPKARHRSSTVANFRTTCKGKLAHIPPLQRDLSETPCCTFIQRHLDRVIVSFDPKLLHPRNYHLRLDQPMHRSGSGANTLPAGLAPGGEKVASKLRLLSDHLLHRRRVWVTSYAPHYSTSSTCLMHIFYSLTLLRLQEGFHILQSKDGFLNMYQDLYMRDVGSGDTMSCSVQYLIYLHRVSRRSRNQESISSGDQSISYTEKAFSTPEDDGPMLVGDQVVSEVWIEPQVGQLVLPQPEFAGWEGKTVEEIPAAMFNEDRECLQIYMTLQQLRDKFLVYDIIPQSSCSMSDGQTSSVKLEYMEPNVASVCAKSPSLTLKLALYRFTKSQKNTDACLNEFISHLCDQVCGDNRFSEVQLSDAEARNFTYEVVLPLIQKQQGHSTPSGNHSAVEIFRSVEQSCWRCFVKVCSENSDHLTILVIPSNTEALKNLGIVSQEDFNYLPLYLFVSSRLYIGYIIEDKWTYEKPPHRQIRINDDNDTVTKEFEKDFRDSFDKAAKKTEKLTDEMEKLAEHIIGDAKLLVRLYSTTYLESVYLCLQKRLFVHEKDLDYAFHNLCDDLPPLEINITRYLRSVCGHCWPYDRPQRTTQTFDDKTDGEDDDGVGVPRRSLVGPLIADLNDSDTQSCERRKGLHERIRRRVRALVSKYFTRIPNCQDYFVFRLAKEAMGEPAKASELMEQDANNTTENGENAVTLNPDRQDDDWEDGVLLGSLERKLSFLDASGTGESTGEDLDDFDQSHVGERRPQKLFPFFFHIGCTVTYKGAVVNVIVDHIPTCLGEFKGLFETNPSESHLSGNERDVEEDASGDSSGDNEVHFVNRNYSDKITRIDLDQVKITLDLYPLTMRDDNEGDGGEDDLEKDHFAQVSNESEIDADNDDTDDGLRDSSNNSIVFKRKHNQGAPSGVPIEMDSEEGEGESEEEDGRGTSAYSLSQSGLKSCNILPPIQRRTFDTCKEELEWILEDEIICCMKYDAGLDENYLQSIVDHINCMMERKERFMSASSVLHCISRVSKRLRFVLSWEEGCKSFFEQFALASIGEDFRIVQIGTYYCVCGLVPDSAQLPPWQAKDIPSWTNKLLAGDADPPQIIDSLPGHSADKLWKPSAIKPSLRQRHQRGTSHSVPFDRPVAQHGGLYRSASLSELSSVNMVSDSRKTSLTIDPVAALKTSSASMAASGVVPPASLTSRDASEVTRARSAGPSQKMFYVPSSGQLSQRDRPLSSMTSPNTSENVGQAYGMRSTPGQHQNQGTTIASSSVGMFHSRGASSRGSLAEGYDGDFSSIGGPDDMNWGLDNDFTASDGMPVRPPCGHHAGTLAGDGRNSPTMTIPPFWLIVRLNMKHLEVYFHHTDSHVEAPNAMCLFCGVRDRLMEEIEKLNRLVNQKMLLNDLLDTRRCNSLLVAASQEEIQCLGDEANAPPGVDVYANAEEDGGESADMAWWYKNKMDPGHFMCPLIWRELFPIDKRIQMTLSGRPGRVLSNLRTALDIFAVSNRKDMYVMTFNGTLYMILSELYCENGSEGLGAISTADLTNSIDTRSMGGGMHQAEDAVSVSSFATTTDQSHGLLQHQESGGPSGSINTLEMCVYGISNPDTDVRQNLNNLMQSKLDNLLLGFLCSCLMRHYNLRLHHHDIRFIQPPMCLPNLCLNLQPPQLVQPFLVPFCFYLKQHLNHFLISPRFAAADRFMIPTGPVVDGKTVNVADSDASGFGEAYVYNTYFGESIPTYGLACVVAQLVCGWNADPGELISCPAPSVLSGELLTHQHDLQSLVQVRELPEPRSPSRKTGPGPANYLRFFVWKRGDVDVNLLRHKLESAVRAACEDVLMEYRLLTMPIADNGGQLREVYASAPEEVALAPPRSATVSGGSGSAPMASPIKRRQSLADVFRLWTTSKSQTGSGAEDNNNPSPRSSTLDSQGHVAETVQYYMDLEAGEAGQLHSIYPGLMLNWMEYVGKDNLLDKNFSWYLFFKRTFKLRSTISIASFLEMGVRFFHPTISKGSLFQLVTRPDGSETWRLHHVSSTSDTEPLKLSSRPGERQRFILIGRNYQHWSKHMSSRGLLEISRPTSISNEVWHYLRGLMRLSGSEDSKDDSQSSKGLGLSQDFGKNILGGLESRLPDFCRVKLDNDAVIPRQLFCLLHVNGTQVSFYSYNFSKDTNARIADLLAGLVDWHNTRFQLFSSLVRQKMGVFQGLEETCSSFNSSEKARQVAMMGLPPPAKTPVPGHSSGPMGRGLPGSRSLMGPLPASVGAAASVGSNDAKAPAYRSFVQTLHTTRWSGDLPPVHRGANFAADVIQRHGQQVLQARKYEMDMDREKTDLEDLARRWYLKVASGSRISDERLTRMKSSCRVLHTVTVPLLLHPSFGVLPPAQRTAPLAAPVARRKHSLAMEKKRHNSEGAGLNLQRSAVVPLARTVSTEEDWVRRLKTHVLARYEEYLVRKLRFNEAVPRGRQDACLRGPYSLMFKCIYGGAVILVELLFRGAYFTVRVAAIEHQRLFWRLARGSTPRETRLAFVDETDRLCHLTHVASFMHDFHLLCVANHIVSDSLEPLLMTSAGDSPPELRMTSQTGVLTCTEEATSFLRPKYNVIAFLERTLAMSEGRPPLYAASFVLPWSLRVDCKPTCCVSGEKLFDYILAHDHAYGLRTLAMRSADGSDEFCLVEKANLATDGAVDNPSLRDVTCYVLISKDVPREALTDSSSTDSTGLSLRLFFLFVNSKQSFPNASLERCRVTTKERHLPAIRPCLVAPLPDVRVELGLPSVQEVNYLGWDARPQRPVADILSHQKQHWREHLHRVVRHAADGAHKDNLWSRLFGALLNGHASSAQASTAFEASVGPAVASQASPSSNDNNQAMQFSEINEILARALVIDIKTIDARLLETLNFNAGYHDAMMRLICQSYPHQSARFNCREGEREFNGSSSVVVLIQPEYRKGFLLLTKSTTGHSALTLNAVFQDSEQAGGRSLFYSSPLVDLVHGVAELCCFLLWRKLHF